MTVGSALRKLGRVLDEFERSGAVRSVGLVDSTDADAQGSVTADVELTVATRATGGSDTADSVEGGDRADTAEGDVVPLSLAAPTVGEDGTLRLAFESADALVPAAEGVTVEPATVTGGEDGTLTVVFSVSVRTDGAAAGVDEADGAIENGDSAAATGVDDVDDESEDGTGGGPARDTGREAARDGGAADGAVERDRDVPPFRDPDLLREVYDSCETFAEMAEALGMDVTGETVRRYMIDAGVHQPTTYDTGTAGDEDTNENESAIDPDEGTAADHPAETDSPEDEGTTSEPEPATTATERNGIEGRDGTTDAESPVVLADGIGLPNDVTVDALVETVKRSNTIYEIEREIGVDRDDALDVLRELNLLDLVVGRLATEEERDDISREAVIERLRQASATATR